MNREIDARGLQCPQPVILARKALEEMNAGTVTVIVDSMESRENVRRYAANQGCDVEVAERGGCHYLTISKRPGRTITEEKAPLSGPDVVCITTARLGEGSEELGGILMKAFLNTLWDDQRRPSRIIFLNAGVFLTVEGSDVLDSLTLLEREGVEILSCGTCLAYYGVREKLKIGRVSNMHEIVESLMTAGRVINI
ncbi:MAG: sulfurtransferase-like selenium metabolism protein YedF [Syntrophales bacterium]